MNTYAQMHINPILSICIPTFNRASSLLMCLDSIFKENNSQSIEVIISDNASSDNTQEIMLAYQKEYPSIIYRKNNRNLGFDKNILLAIEDATGKFVMLLGDDDGILPGALEPIIHQLKVGHLEYAHTTAVGFDKDLKKPIKEVPRTTTEIKTYRKLSEFIPTLTANPMHLVGVFGGMSGQIFKREHWINLPNKEQWTGTQAIHIFVLLRAFKDLPFTIILNPTIATRNESIRWDTFPGLETANKRVQKTAETAVWISELYNLNLKKNDIVQALKKQAYIIMIKNIVKYFLRLLHLRK